MTPSKIPLSFLQQNASLSWKEVLWAYERKIIGQHHIVQLAQAALKLDPDEREFELSSIDISHTLRIEELLEELAVSEGGESSQSEAKKWLFLTLAWTFENRRQLSDPLGEVETIYADFGYPNEMEKFVRYMPVADDYRPDQHSHENNIERLFSNWKQYLETTRQEFNALSQE